MSEALWQAEDVLRAAHGTCLHEQGWRAHGVSIDSRTVKKGDLYIALPGSADDGHNHVADAFSRGAVAAIVTRQPSQVPADAPLLFVDDTLEALHELARAARARSRAKIIAVTGCGGVSSTKDMLRLALGAVGHAYATDEGCSHALWDLPLALSCLPPEADYGVFSINIYHQNGVAALAELARPDIAIVTAIENINGTIFGSADAVADLAGEIFQGMLPTGIAIINKHDEFCARLVAAAKTEGIKKILTFARESRADAKLVDVAITSEGCAVNAVISGYKAHYAIGSPGAHLAQSSLPVLLAASLASGKIAECASALARYKPTSPSLLSAAAPRVDQKLAS